MPRLIDAGHGEAIDLPALGDLLADARIDVRDEDAFASLGPALARLGRNPRFLADCAIAELKTRFRRQSAINGYGPQVLMLRASDGRFAVRANLWPARADRVTRASGADAFFYDLPHDHNFPFLTYGYLGPGYWSDYYEVAADPLRGVAGEAAGLRFVERARLEPGRLMLYRMRRDVHVQLPPDRFSVSLNILGIDPAQPWVDQFRYDIATDTVAAALTHTPAEALVTLAVHCGGDGAELARDMLHRHPCARMQATALAALAGQADGRALLEQAARGAGRVAAEAERRLRRMDASEADAARAAG